MSGCWLWYAGGRAHYHQDLRGYIALEQRRPSGKKGHVMESAPRVAWRLFRGDIPTGLYVLHTCDVALCVNPTHLYLGTQQDNMDDRERRGRGNYLPNLAKAQIFNMRRHHHAAQQRAS